ncbi:MAG: hypothetical protein QXD77_02600 [Candidatus Aenigmatarchaeota archaeon]
MKSMKIGKYIDYLESKKVTPQDIMSTLRTETEYILTLRKEGERQKLTIRKYHGIAFMGYKNNRLEVPYGDMRIIDDIMGKIKER